MHTLSPYIPDDKHTAARARNENGLPYGFSPSARTREHTNGRTHVNCHPRTAGVGRVKTAARDTHAPRWPLGSCHSRIARENVATRSGIANHGENRDSGRDWRRRGREREREREKERKTEIEAQRVDEKEKRGERG